MGKRSGPIKNLIEPGDFPALVWDHYNSSSGRIKADPMTLINRIVTKVAYA